MRKETPHSGADSPVYPKPLSARTVQKRLATLPDWGAVGGNRGLVTRFRPPDLLTALLSAAAAVNLAEIWRGHTQVESRGLEVLVYFTTPAAGGVTRNDLRLAALFSAAQPRLAPSGDWREAIEQSAGMRETPR